MTTAMTKQDNGKGLSEARALRSWASAPVDVFESASEYLVYADVPGTKHDDVQIQYEKGELRLEARRKLDAASDWPTDYRRVFTVGTDVDVERIHAALKDGVLLVHIPKLESARPRQITVQVT
jgi:HSP20 family molecular chaperone IbpA